VGAIEQESPWYEPTLVIAIAGMALAVRLYDLSGRSLWLDEVVTANTMRINNLMDVIMQSRHRGSEQFVDVNQMPLSYIAEWLLRPWGDGEFVLRLPSVVEGTLAVVAAYVLARGLYGVRAGVIAAVLSAIFPFEVWYSQEARTYALFMLLTTLQMYAAFVAVKHGRVRHWFAVALFTTLNLYTHYLAFFPTAAAAVYIGIFLLADLLQGTSLRVKSAVVSMLFLIALTSAFTPWRPLFQQAEHHLGLTAGIAVVVVVLLVVVGYLVRSQWLVVIRARPRSTIQLTRASLAGILTAAAYVPWLPQLRAFINRPETSIGRLPVDHPLGIVDVFLVFVRLGFSGVLLAAFVVGIGVVIVRLSRGKAAESGLLVAWLCVSVLLLLRTAGVSLLAIDVRYLAFLVPAALIVIAAGVDGLAGVVEWAVARGRSYKWLPAPGAGTAVSLLLVGVILVQAIPALAATLQAPKDDWRSAAQRIVASSPQGAVVFAVGDYSDWSVISLHYYFRRLNATVMIVDTKEVNVTIAAQLAQTKVDVWGVVVYANAEQKHLLDHPSTERTEFVDVTAHIYLVRATDQSASTIEQARTLFHWEEQVQRQAHAPATVLDLYTGRLP
jgi:hypothetical protein